MTLLQKCQALIKNNLHALLLIVYLLAGLHFQYLQDHVVRKYEIACALDKHIPFVSAFVIPYILWAGYIAITLGVFCFKDKPEFMRLCSAICVGMYVSFFFYWFWPHGQILRPEIPVLEAGNIFDQTVAHLYKIDTPDEPTNCAPSIHVLNAMAVNFSIWRSSFTAKWPWVRWSSSVLMISIVLSTVLIKQHSILDVFMGIALAYLLQGVFYMINWQRLLPKRRARA